MKPQSRKLFSNHALLLRGLLLCFALTLSQTTVIAQSGNSADSSSSTSSNSTNSSSNANGPVRLRQSPSAGTADSSDTRSDDRRRKSAKNGLRDDDRFLTDRLKKPEYKPGEFERYVQRLVDPAPEPETQIRRFGAELMTEDSGDTQDFNPVVPPDYIVVPGDEVVITIWGSVDADLRLEVDRAGRINIPRVGAILVAGTTYGDLPAVISRRVAQVFKNFQLTVGLGQLRGVRIFVTGFVLHPGAYSVSSLSTVMQAVVKAGGPSAAGSLRNVQLRRGNQPVATLDLYDLLLKGDRSADRTLQPDDVVHVGAIGPLVALIGSVNKPAVFELKPGETIADGIRMAGGFAAVADPSRVVIERLDERNEQRLTQLDLPQGGSTALRNGDVVRAISNVAVAQPVQRQNKRVRIEGEVARPGEYVLPPSSSFADALVAAGGLTPAAYVFGTEFSRESVRITQQDNYDRALRDLETEFARSTSTQRTSTADEAAAQTARAGATTRLVERLRSIRPTGRVVLQMGPDSRELPNLALEDGDRLYVPPRPTTVGVFGSVFNGGSYLYSTSRTLDDYLRLAGGPTRGADADSVFVIRANGSVVSNRQSSGWLTSGKLAGLPAEPGDTVFVPEEINKTTFIQNAKDWTQILYQFGLGVAAFVTLRNY